MIKSKIEIAPRNQWLRLNQANARLYMFSIGDGWRLPTLKEYFNPPFPQLISEVWDTVSINDPLMASEFHMLIPVRDLKDD